MPRKSTLSPVWGQSVGGVSERPTRIAEGSNPRAHLQSQRSKAPRFTGCRQPSRDVGVTWVLVGPSFVRNGTLPLRAGAPTTKGVLWQPRRGTSSACARRTHSTWRPEVSTFSRTRPSLGPEARARQSALNSNGATRGRCRDGRDIEVGQTWVTRRNRQRGHERTDENARLAACHRFTGQLVRVVRDA
jgi:hypothetical protein